MSRWSTRTAQIGGKMGLPTMAMEIVAIVLILLVIYLSVPLITKIFNSPSSVSPDRTILNNYAADAILDQAGLLSLINQERSARNLPPLAEADSLEQAAMQAATTALQNQLLLPERKRLEQHLANSGYEASRWDAQLTYGHSSNASAIEWFRTDQAANQVILDSAYSQAGIAVLPGVDTNIVALYVADPSEPEGESSPESGEQSAGLSPTNAANGPVPPGASPGDTSAPGSAGPAGGVNSCGSVVCAVVDDGVDLLNDTVIDPVQRVLPIL